MATLETILAWLQLACLAPLAVFGLHRGALVLVQFLPRRRSPPPAPAADADLPRVTVQLPIYCERYVATRLVAAVAALDYPRDKLQIQVLDDSTDDTPEIVARALRKLPADCDVEHVRRVDRAGFKAGALAHGLGSATGEFVAVFDADFVPRPDFLRRTIPHFADPRVGLVQARWEHLNAGPDLLTDLQANLLDGHFFVEHVARSSAGCLFNFNGTAGVFRRRAIEDAGGWQHDTLTEDMDLSYRAQLAGWKFVYLPELGCPAELPPDMNGFLKQQHRWAKGSVQTGRKLIGRILRHEGIGGLAKVEAVFHLFGNLAFPILLALFLVSLPLHLLRAQTGDASGTPFAWLEGLPIMLATSCVLIYYGLARVRARSLLPYGWLRLPLVFAIGAGLCVNNTCAVLSAFRRRTGTFERTPKFGGPARPSARYRSTRGALPLLELALAVWVASSAVFAFRAGLSGTGVFLSLFAAGLSWSGGRSLRENHVPLSAPPQPAVSSART